MPKVKRANLEVDCKNCLIDFIRDHFLSSGGGGGKEIFRLSGFLTYQG